MKVFSNNMGKKSEPIITKCKEGENWTKVSFKPDLAKFNMNHLEDDVVALMKKRVIDIAGCLGKTVKVDLNGQRVPVKSFLDYVNLYLQSASKARPDPLPRFLSELPLSCFIFVNQNRSAHQNSFMSIRIAEKVNDRWEICVSLSEGQFQQVLIAFRVKFLLLLRHHTQHNLISYKFGLMHWDVSIDETYMFCLDILMP